MATPTVIAVDWSGAKHAPAQRRAIWMTVVQDGRIVESAGGRTRDEVVDALLRASAPLVAGLDFSFAAPAWFARREGCESIDALWARAAKDGERWLRPAAPFWRDRCDVEPEARFRRCERRVRDRGFPAKSVFQLVGNGQVGAGSVRGMPLLARLRAGGFAIWPFDASGERTLVEIYPSLLRARAPELEAGNYRCSHERDATVAALVMWRHRDELRRLPASDDAATRFEGDIWDPI